MLADFSSETDYLIQAEERDRAERTSMSSHKGNGTDKSKMKRNCSIEDFLF